jgi:ADP-ribose pyrophosphatase YjhB (NUDIX family)
MIYLQIFENFLNKPNDSEIQASVVLIENLYGEILLLKKGVKSKQQGWCLPGGKREKGESLLENVVRETKEETGLKIKKSKFKFVYTGLSVRGYYVNVYYTKLYEYQGVKISEEHSDYKWTNKYQMLNLAGNTGEYIDMVKKWKTHLNNI